MQMNINIRMAKQKGSKLIYDHIFTNCHGNANGKRFHIMGETVDLQLDDLFIIFQGSKTPL